MSLDIFEQYATDEKLENGGTWKAIGKGTRLLVARSGNPQYAKRLTKLVEQSRAVLDLNDDVADSTSDKIMIDVIASTILLGWENLTFKKQPMPYSVENAKELLKVKEFRRQVVEISQDINNYKIKEELQQGEA